MAASLWHPHIVGVHDRGEHYGQDVIPASVACLKLFYGVLW